MASKFDESEFVDSDYEESRKPANTYSPAAFATPQPHPQAPMQRPPTREEIESKMTDAHSRLAELKRVQEDLERERAQLEEARRRRVEYQTGREEMLNHLTRGIEILKESEFNTRREADQMSRSLGDLGEALGKVETLKEESWTQENWNTELTRALAILENARMEWNSARVKWSLLDGIAATPMKGSSAKNGSSSLLENKSFRELCKFGFALSWPIAAATLLGTGIIAIILLAR